MEKDSEDVKPVVETVDRKITVEEVKEKLKTYFNYDNFKSDVQQKAIMSILKGKNSYIRLISMTLDNCIHCRGSKCLHINADRFRKVTVLPITWRFL